MLLMDSNPWNNLSTYNLTNKIKPMDLMLFVRVVKHQEKKSNSNNSLLIIINSDKEKTCSNPKSSNN